MHHVNISSVSVTFISHPSFHLTRTYSLSSPPLPSFSTSVPSNSSSCCGQTRSRQLTWRMRTLALASYWPECSKMINKQAWWNFLRSSKVDSHQLIERLLPSLTEKDTRLWNTKSRHKTSTIQLIFYYKKQSKIVKRFIDNSWLYLMK